MLKDLAHHPAFRTGALLFSVSVVGVLLGVAWEDATYGKVESELERMENQVDAAEAKQEGVRRSKRDEAILARSLTYFPPYPNAGRPEALAADYLGPDVPIAVAFFTTKDSSDQVLQHYRKVILDQGLPVIGVRFSENSGYVGYWEPDTEEIRLVSTLAQGGETMAFVSAGQMGNMLQRRAAQIPDWVPVPPNLRQASTMTLNMEGLQNTTVTGRVAAESVDDAERDYRSTLRLQGWKAEAGSSPGFQQRELVVSNTGMRGQVILKKAAGSGEVEFHLSLMQKPEALP
ncbi:hypothetical protein [Corallococcus carmarthensis]|uniref:Uncharacterized protein n=1 Tax=Corallococcus carmarthensis TaxID=2316728 RepID=A0A3A8JIE1_9BACT|nr:hypothetical protein [Corallococcus carmarthensis]NOK21884.1 hypothetical protein [Corallococcus carmarthensis]RKG95507.1 hypothetical protein D7X32_38835 [Corallococcus carmarthensis]